MKWLNALLPVVTLILGYLGTLLTESRRDARARRVAREERAELRRQAHSEDRRSFELETLKSTQVALAALARATGKAHHHDLMDSRAANTDQFPVGRLPQDVDDEVFSTNRDLARLVDLILDENLREAVEKVRSEVAGHSALTNSTVSEAERRLNATVDAVQAAHEVVGARVRGIYVGTVNF